jgi:hypothetical protein
MGNQIVKLDFRTNSRDSPLSIHVNTADIVSHSLSVSPHDQFSMSLIYTTSTSTFHS